MWNCLSNINYYENKLSKWIAGGGESVGLDMDFTKICRTCLRDAPDTNNLLSDFEIGAINFNFDGRVLRLIDMLAESTSIEVSDSDTFPHQVCNNCIHNISGAYFYRLQCHKANSLLHRLEDALTKPVEPEESPQSDTMKSSITNYHLKENDVGKSISSFFIELSEGKTEPIDPDESDNGTNEEAKEMSVEFDGMQYQIDSEIFHVDIEDDEGEETQFNEGEENQFDEGDEGDEENKLSEMDEDNESAPADQVSEDVIEENELKSNMMLEEIKIEILDNNIQNSNERTENSVTSLTKQPRNQRKKGGATGNEFRCDLCDAKFTKVQSLKRHVKIHQADQRNKLCAYCGKAFIRADDLTRHIRTHTGERPYSCNLCPKKYKQTSELNEHLLTHSKEKKFICPICGNALQTRNGYYVHMLIHRGEKRHRCVKCGNRYVTSGELQSHIRHIHDKVKPYRCRIGDCARCFTTKHSLEIHERAHTGERPFKCTLCTKAFSAKSSLQDHLRLHCGSTPYKCSVCDKGIHSHQGLKKHMQAHEARGETEGNQMLTCDLFETIDNDRSDIVSHGIEESAADGFEHLNRSLLRIEHTMENVIEEEEMYIIEEVKTDKT